MWPWVNIITTNMGKDYSVHFGNGHWGTRVLTHSHLCTSPFNIFKVSICHDACHRSRVCSSKIFSGMPWPSRKLHTCREVSYSTGDPPLPQDPEDRGPQSHWIFLRLVAEMIAAVREQVVGVKAGISLLCRSAFRAFHDVIPLRS